MRYIVVDLETTDREPEKAHIVEWAAFIVTPLWLARGGEFLATGGLVKPPVPIPAETSAVHHIIDEDVAHKPTWEEERHRLVELFADGDAIAVAHNANFERTMLSSLNLPCKWLCTYKAAVRVWPDCPSHSNECLRYWLGFGAGRSARQSPHSAMHDATVTAKLLATLIEKGTTLEDMLRWTDEPALLPRCPLGDWRGTPWAEVDAGFLEWILRKIHDREDVRFCAKTELERRATEAHKQAVTVGDDDDSDIPF